MLREMIMPGPKKKSKDVKFYTEGFTTEGQSVTNDGSQVIMNNGQRFKRVVLPSVAEANNRALAEAAQLKEELEGLDAPATTELEQE